MKKGKGVISKFSWKLYFEIIIDLTVSYKNSTARCHVLFTQFLPLSTSLITPVQYQSQELDVDIKCLYSPMSF